MKNSLKLRISAIGAALTALGSSPHASALDPESPRKKRPTISHLRQLEDVSSDPCDENELDFKLDLMTDDYGDLDNSWVVADKETGFAIAVGGSLESNTEYHFRQCLPACGSYEFTLHDDFGDGLTRLDSAISTTSYFQVSIDEETPLSLSLDDAKVEAFSKKRLSFDGSAKCTEVPSLRIVVNDDSLDDKYCLQPRNVWKDDFIIVAKPCNESKMVQLWTVDFMGQWRNAHGDNMCITTEGGKVTLGTCSESYEEGYPTNFIYNKFSRAFQLFNKNEKALTLNMRDMSVKVRDYASPDHNLATRQNFIVEKAYTDLSSI